MKSIQIQMFITIFYLFAGSLEFKITKNSVLHGFACWFDCIFEGKNPVTLPTGPEHAPTHWQQTVILLPESLLVSTLYMNYTCTGTETDCTELCPVMLLTGPVHTDSLTTNSKFVTVSNNKLVSLLCCSVLWPIMLHSGSKHALTHWQLYCSRTTHKRVPIIWLQSGRKQGSASIVHWLLVCTFLLSDRYIFLFYVGIINKF